MKKTLTILGATLLLTGCGGVRYAVETPSRAANIVSGIFSQSDAYTDISLSKSAQGVFYAQVHNDSTYCDGYQAVAGIGTFGGYDASIYGQYPKEIEVVFSKGIIDENHCSISYFSQKGHFDALSSMDKSQQYAVVAKFNNCASKSVTEGTLQACWDNVANELRG